MSAFHLALAVLCLVGVLAAADEGKGRVVLVVHGGAGVLDEKKMTPELRKEYEAGLTQALREGHAALKKGSSLDAVEAAIRVLEDNPLFNAGKGAVFTSDGKHELDASIMRGDTLQAGAVGAVTIVKNPITAARRVMEQSKHVLLIGRGAEDFALEQKLDIVPNTYFSTPQRRAAWKKAKEKEEQGRDWTPPLSRYFGTVGAVAYDGKNLAAGTSTGGMTNKRYGRVGDSPIIGAGTYADNRTCAVSCTGHGEMFIRYGVAKEVSSRRRYLGDRETLEESARKALFEVPPDDPEERKRKPEEWDVGGLIALDSKGNVAMPFNSEGMYRGTITDKGEVVVKIYRER